MSIYINGYTLALLSLAKEEKKLKKYKQNSLDLIYVFLQNPNYIKIMDAKDLDNKIKYELIDKAFKKNIETNILNFIKLLADKFKMKSIVLILKKLIKLINHELNINEGIVYTTNKLSSDKLKKVEQATSKKIGYKISLQNKIDKELVSGIKIVIDDEFIEDTISSRLKQLKDELLDKEEETNVN